ncbi:MAG: PBP1A family penicillin-binding protein, partial [Candidatus Hydrogenedentales bacterium]
MAETSSESRPRRRTRPGCGLIFFCIMMVVAAVWGACLGAFVLLLEDAETKITALDTYRPKVGSRIYSSDDELLGEYNIENRQLVNLNEMPLHLQKAFIATEDDIFFEHKGVRPDAIANAFLFILRTRKIRGGSTITQQLVRNVEEATTVGMERTMTRKLREAVVALQVEREFTKDEILELYLNQLFLGGGVYGVEAASQFYFGKSCRDLTIAESATLAGVVLTPNKNRPDRFPERATARRQVVLGQMLENRFITQAEYDEAIATNVVDYTIMQEQRDTAASGESDRGVWRPNQFKAAYFVEETRQRSYNEGLVNKDALLEQGLEIITTIDMNLQRAAEETLFKVLDDFDERRLASLKKQNRENEFVPVTGALICLDNRPQYSGFVRALVGGRDFNKEKFNTATQAQRQPGSSVKPFVWLAALDDGRKSGLTAASIKMDSPFERFDGAGNKWSPKNFSGDYLGPVTLRYALEKSINVVSVRLVEELGMPAVRTTIEDAGFTIPIDDAVGLTIGLGTHMVTVLDQAVAYSTIAKGGVYSPPIFIAEIRDRDGLTEWKATVKREVRFKADVACVVTSLLRSVCDAPWGTGARSSALKRPHAGKTGTTNDSRDVWFCGFTPQFTCVVWVGYRDNRSLGKGADFTGGRLA